MKTRFHGVLVSLAVVVCSTGLYAEIGGGVIIGNPTGISIRVNQFPVLGVAWSMDDDRMHVHGDYWILHKPLSVPLNWYLGAGGSIEIGKKNIGVGVRIPAGLQFPFERKWELFGELAPVVMLVQETGFSLEGGIGIRYIF